MNLTVVSAFAQAGFQATLSNPEPNPFSICDNNPSNGECTVSWNALDSGITNPRIEILSPPGLIYLPNSHKDIIAPLLQLHALSAPATTVSKMVSISNYALLSLKKSRENLY